MIVVVSAELVNPITLNTKKETLAFDWMGRIENKIV